MAGWMWSSVLITVEWQVVKWRMEEMAAVGVGGEQTKVIINPYRRESQGSKEGLHVWVWKKERQRERQRSKAALFQLEERYLCVDEEHLPYTRRKQHIHPGLWHNIWHF